MADCGCAGRMSKTFILVADIARVPMSAATGSRSAFAFRLLASLCLANQIFPRTSHLKEKSLGPRHSSIAPCGCSQPHIPGTFSSLSLCRPPPAPSPEEKRLRAGPVRDSFIIVTTAFLGTNSGQGNYERTTGVSLMASADEYYEYVEQCIALASRCLHAGDKVRLFQMAKAWRDLAEKLDASQSGLEASQNRPAEKDFSRVQRIRRQPAMVELRFVMTDPRPQANRA